MSMRIGFTGASGTGKTTLAAYLSERYGLPTNPVGARSVAAAMGYATPYAAHAAGAGPEFQRRLIADKCAWELAADRFVADRTTADNLAYLALHGIDAVTDEVMREAVDGLERYTHVILCPMVAFHDLAGDPARKTSRAYHEVFEALAFAIVDKHAPRVVVLWQGDLDARRRALDALF